MQIGEFMYAANHYVPILRWKRGERFALAKLAANIRSAITPLVELTPKMFEAPVKGRSLGLKPEPSEVLFQASKGLLKDWGNAPVFVDFWHIDGQIPPSIANKRPLEYMADEARRMRLALIPVTSLGRSAEHQEAVRHVTAIDERGVCIRVTPEDVLQQDFRQQLQNLLKKLTAKRDQVHLILDYQVFDGDKPLPQDLLNRIPHIEEWRTLTLASGAFPKDLQEYTPGIQRIDRNDWLTWLRVLDQRRSARKPSFADYTIQYGRYVEPPGNCNPSASIRYTLAEQWLVMRGEGIMNKKGPGREQWPANATLLCEREEFYGSTFSSGDRYIYRVSNGDENHGSPETWIRAGINHHMTLVARQIGALGGS